MPARGPVRRLSRNPSLPIRAATTTPISAGSIGWRRPGRRSRNPSLPIRAPPTLSMIWLTVSLSVTGRNPSLPIRAPPTAIQDTSAFSQPCVAIPPYRSRLLRLTRLAKLPARRDHVAIPPTNQGSSDESAPMDPRLSWIFGVTSQSLPTDQGSSDPHLGNSLSHRRRIRVAIPPYRSGLLRRLRQLHQRRGNRSLVAIPPYRSGLLRPASRPPTSRPAPPPSRNPSLPIRAPPTVSQGVAVSCLSRNATVQPP